MARSHKEVLPVGAVSLSHRVEYVRDNFMVTIPPGFTVEDLLDPEFWRNQTCFKANDRIEAVAADGSFDCDLRIISAGPGFVMTRLLREWRAPETSDHNDGARVGLAPGQGFVAYGRDGSPISRHGTKDEAKAALDAWLAANPAPAEAA
ncbi:hypothetical protein [Rhodomicrobium sp.]|uniref:hypothetical protein n=1 Tax=Rhodomicrobium sp. TaxID=2720632 RepID=UPI0039E47F86